MNQYPSPPKNLPKTNLLLVSFVLPLMLSCSHISNFFDSTGEHGSLVKNPHEASSSSLLAANGANANASALETNNLPDLLKVEVEELSEDQLGFNFNTEDEEEGDSQWNLNSGVDAQRVPFPNFADWIKFSQREDENSGHVYPGVDNKYIRMWENYFAGKGQERFKLYLERSFAFLPYVSNYFASAGLPRELGYLALVESGFNPKAVSPANAVGLWQFMSATGRLYGLKINHWVDERRDPFKATKAAAEHLGDLKKIFGDWYLAVSAYNAGAGKILRAQKRYRSHDFWHLIHFRYLKAETRNYVPQLIATIKVLRNPEKYGFTDLNFAPYMDHVRVKLEKTALVEDIATALGMDQEQFRKWNPELLKHMTPPTMASYEINIPKKLENKVAGLHDYLKQKAFDQKFEIYAVKSQETIRSIARKYHVDAEELRSANLISSRWGKAEVAAGDVIIIPKPEHLVSLLHSIRNSEDFLIASAVRKSKRHNAKRLAHTRHLRSFAKKSAKGRETVEHSYRIKRGDTLAKIARRYKVQTASIIKWNSLKNKDIRPGKRISIYRSAN